MQVRDLDPSDQMNDEKRRLVIPPDVKRRRALLAGTAFVIVVSSMKNVQALMQIMSGMLPAAVWNDKVGFTTGIVFFAIGAVLIRDKWWHLGWLMIILNEVLTFSASHAFSAEGNISILPVSAGTALLCVGIYCFFRYKKISEHMET